MSNEEAEDLKWEKWNAERGVPARRLTDAMNTAETVKQFNAAYQRTKEQAVSTEPITTVTDFQRTDTGETVQVERTEFLSNPGEHRESSAKPSIIGYRELTTEEIDLGNAFKAKANELGEIIEQIRKMPATDQRWLSIGATQIQQGSMAVGRSIYRPKSFA